MSIKSRVDVLEKKHDTEGMQISYDHAIRIVTEHFISTRNISPEEARKAAEQSYNQKTGAFDLDWVIANAG